MDSRHFRLALALALGMLTPNLGVAQTAGPGGMTLPGSSGQTCVQVEIVGEKPSVYNCLNQELQRQVEGTSRPAPSLPLSATSQSNQVGTFNEQGVAEQYGQNFGKSAIPYRPSPPVFNNSLGGAR